MPEPVSARPVPKMRPKNLVGGKQPPRRPRPKTIHVDAADTHSIMSAASAAGGKKRVVFKHFR